MNSSIDHPIRISFPALSLDLLEPLPEELGDRQNDSGNDGMGFCVLWISGGHSSGDFMKLSARNTIAGTILGVTKGQTTAHVQLDTWWWARYHRIDY